MSESLLHESFYRTGTWESPKLGLYLGWTTKGGEICRSARPDGPLSDPAVFIAGELFQAENASEDMAGGFSRRDASQPCWPDSTELRQLNGFFHGLAADEGAGVISLFNDRYGMSRLYVHQSEGTFYFACEAKAILAVRPGCRSIDHRGLGEFLTCGCVLEHRTLYAGVEVLPSASVLTFEHGMATSRRTYFSPKEWEEQPALGGEAYYSQLSEVFASCLPAYFRRNGPTGFSLTGGLDTRMMLAWQKLEPSTVPFYSFGSSFRDCEDVALARRVAEVCGQPHSTIPVGEEFFRGFPKFAERAVYLSDGTTAVNRASDLYVNQVARQIAPIRLTGNYGGEVLRRVRAFKPGRPSESLYSGDLVEWFDRSRECYRNLVDCHPLTFSAFRQAPFHHYGLLGLEQTQVDVRTPYLDNEFVKTVYRATPETCADSEICLRLIAEGNSRLAGIRTDRGLVQAGDRTILTAVRSAMLEFTFKAEYAYDYGMPQWVARIDGSLSALRLERLFLGRHKFAHYRFWYRTTLAAYVREILLDSMSLARPYLNAKVASEMVEDHTSGKRNFTTAIHQLLTLELIHRCLLERA